MNFFGTAIYHLSYVYHRMDRDEDVLLIINNYLSNDQLYFNRSIQVRLIFRKIIALIKLNDNSYKHLLPMMLVLSNDDEKREYVDLLIYKYNVSRRHFNQEK